jgi:peptide chain release factor 2
MLELQKRKAALEDLLLPYRQMADEYRYLVESSSVLEEEGGEIFLEELARGLGNLEEQVEEVEVRLLLSGEHDRGNAILTINPGAGGTESQDWAQMLLRMYLRWAERRGYETRIVDLLPGEEAGVKSATVSVEGPFAYGSLKVEAGVHRLVRISPFDASKRRHTSFTAVLVTPEIEEDVEVQIRDEDIRVDTFRASGAGGQHVNKTSSAVRITHLPTGIVASCQTDRSQHRNREVAMKILRSRLYELELAEKERAMEGLVGEKKEIAWGSQIRSYVLHPYQMVKDHRTGVEVGNINAVLDGDLDVFIKAALKDRARRQARKA